MTVSNSDSQRFQSVYSRMSLLLFLLVALIDLLPSDLVLAEEVSSNLILIGVSHRGAGLEAVFIHHIGAVCIKAAQCASKLEQLSRIHSTFLT